MHQFHSDDWPLFKKLRLEALLTDPGVFGAFYQQESLRSDDEWKSRLCDVEKAYFGLFTENNECIGLTGIAKQKDDPQTAILVASYIRRGYRGQGLSSLLYKSRLQWAKNNDVKKTIISHREGNQTSKSANQHFGFTYTHTENVIWPDGEQAPNVFYKLML